jgi:hypothetical protein
MIKQKLATASGLLAILLSFVGCRTIGSNEVEINLNIKSVHIVEKYKKKYGFEKITIFKTVNQIDYPISLHINAINGKGLPISMNRLSEVQINLGSDIYYSLGSVNKDDIEKIYVLFTQDNGRFFFKKAHSEVVILNVNDNILTPDFKF